MSMRESRGQIVCAEILACIEQINNVVTNSWTISALLQYAKICLWPWLLFRPQGLFGRKPLTLLISQRLFDRCFFELIIFLSKAISNKFGDNSSSLSQLILFLLSSSSSFGTKPNLLFNKEWKIQLYLGSSCGLVGNAVTSDIHQRSVVRIQSSANFIRWPHLKKYYFNRTVVAVIRNQWNAEFSEMRQMTATRKLCKKLHPWAAAIAPWYCLRQPSCDHWFKSKHTIYAFSICIVEILMRKGRK